MKPTVNLLVAEDSEHDVFLLKRAFERVRVCFAPRFVTDGQEAIDYLEGNEKFADRDKHPLPCLMLLDLKMPRLNGFDVLKWLKSQPGLRRLVVVVFTSSDEPRDVSRAYDLGANSYIVKPAQTTRLPDVVRALEFYWCDFNELAKPAAN